MMRSTMTENDKAIASIKQRQKREVVKILEREMQLEQIRLRTEEKKAKAQERERKRLQEIELQRKEFEKKRAH